MFTPRRLLALLGLIALAVVAYFYPVPGGVISRAGGRRISLQGAPNMRELGGVPLRRGQLRRGMLYRSGALCRITEGDRRVLAALKIRTLVDFRTKFEVERDGPDLMAFGRSLSLPMKLRSLDGVGYGHLVSDFPGEFQTVFALLGEASNYPLLYHCAVGKDRTGILSALLLELLGAERDVIVDDYLQSARNNPRLYVKARWLEGLFREVDRAGGVESYLEGFHIDRAAQRNIRHLLVESEAGCAWNLYRGP